MTLLRVSFFYLITAILMAGLPLFSACANAGFHLSPYAPRGVDVVYSAQEDVTFFVWRLEAGIDPTRVSFELRQDGEYLPIDLDEAPFASEPFDCDRLYLCFQYQLPGQWLPDDAPAIRAIDQRFGSLLSTPTRYQEVQTTLSFDPIAVDNNQSARPDLIDYFDEADIPLRRSFEWTLVDLQDQLCPPASADFTPLRSRVLLPQNWTDNPPCFVVRPVRSDQPGLQLSAPLSPGAVLFTERTEYPLPIKSHHTIVAFLADMQVLNAFRCESIITTLSSTILTRFREKNIPHSSLGVYRPISSDGTEATGCDQASNERYPISELLTDLTREAARHPDEVTFLLIYLNNVELPPTPDKLSDQYMLQTALDADDSMHLFRWGIASNLISTAAPWDVTTPWMPIESKTLKNTLDGVVDYHFPLRSHDFARYQPIPLHAPNQSRGPEYFQACISTPLLYEILAGSSRYVAQYAAPYRWPPGDQPGLIYQFSPNTFVSRSEMGRNTLSGVFEFCDQYCSSHFESADGQRYPSWLNGGRCRWN